jgi:hypothetical protein
MHLLYLDHPVFSLIATTLHFDRCDHPVFGANSDNISESCPKHAAESFADANEIIFHRSGDFCVTSNGVTLQEPKLHR